MLEIGHLEQLALGSTNHDFSSDEYRATAIMLEIAQHRLFRPVRSDVPVEKPKYFTKIEYLHKGIDAINLPGLLRSKLVTDKVPVYLKNREPAILSYQYTNTVASKLFNFLSTLSNLNVTNYLSSPRSCQCQMSKYCYQPHGHIITGDLKLIENAKLRELVSKGPKYREPNKINRKATENMIFESIDLYAERWAKREQDLKYLSKWKETLKKLVTDRISGLKGKFKRPNKKILNDPGVKDCFGKLHEDFVFVPADKAANNIIVICKNAILRLN